MKDIQSGDVAMAYTDSKYAALNINPMRTLGTVEFRHMGGTTHMKEISDWINVILQLKKSSINGVNPQNVEEFWGDIRPLLKITKDDVESGMDLLEINNMWRS